MTSGDGSGAGKPLVIILLQFSFLSSDAAARRSQLLPPPPPTSSLCLSSGSKFGCNLLKKKFQFYPKSHVFHTACILVVGGNRASGKRQAIPTVSSYGMSVLPRSFHYTALGELCSGLTVSHLQSQHLNSAWSVLSLLFPPPTKLLLS